MFHLFGILSSSRDMRRSAFSARISDRQGCVDVLKEEEKCGL